ncbi:hypothetical protein C4D60_Mb08t26630 [Musa balbisiana]|uniref:Uncharacterized protein n=1 Tax=Musa balbisiana TaxID=52838 RepID=A0A4S8K6R9_MUSBA|nr:hypothetical protein C4D60_Mb08t26630 [Musa balbisiana]
MESLISDQNRSIAILVITTLLKTGNETTTFSEKKGGFGCKKAIVDSIVILIRDIPDVYSGVDLSSPEFPLADLRLPERSAVVFTLFLARSLNIHELLSVIYPSVGVLSPGDEIHLGVFSVLGSFLDYPTTFCWCSTDLLIFFSFSMRSAVVFSLFLSRFLNVLELSFGDLPIC